MNRAQLGAIEMPPCIATNSNLISPFFNIGGEPGLIPNGTAITITGEPGTGKTRYLLQVLQNIAVFNKVPNFAFYSYEMGPGGLNRMLMDLDPNDQLNCNFTFSEDIDFKRNAVIGIDSLDEWALRNNSPYPTKEMAMQIKDAKERGCIIFQIHHRAKGKKLESGSALFPRQNDVTIELLKQGSDLVLATTRRKNRYAGQVDQIMLKHTDSGFVVHQGFDPKVMLQNLWTRITT